MADEEKTTEAETVATSSTTIYGVEFTIPARYAEGHPLTAIEARELNKLITENCANNFRGKMKALKEELEKTDKTLDDLTAKQLEKLRADFTENAVEYKFGISRRAGSAALDPVEREARKIALQQVKDAYKEAGHGIKDNLADIKTKADAFYTENVEHFTSEAKAAIKRREEAAKRALSFKV